MQVMPQGAAVPAVSSAGHAPSLPLAPSVAPLITCTLAGFAGGATGAVVELRGFSCGIGGVGQAAGGAAGATSGAGLPQRHVDAVVHQSLR